MIFTKMSYKAVLEGVNFYDFSDIGAFTLWSEGKDIDSHTDNECAIIGYNVVMNDFAGDLCLAYDTVVKR